MNLEELKAEAKRQGYKLIKAKKPRFERCLCGHNVHQWVSGPEGWAVYCKHCVLMWMEHRNTKRNTRRVSHENQEIPSS